MHKRWMIGIIGTGALFGTLIGGTAVMAQTVTPDAGAPGATVTAEEKQNPLQKLSSRVAEILGIDAAQVESAMQQARQELADERVQAKLQRLVEAGRLTQEQADEYLEWFEDRPEDVPGFLGMGGMVGRGMQGHGHGRMHGHGGMGMVVPDGGTMTPTAITTTSA